MDDIRSGPHEVGDDREHVLLGVSSPDALIYGKAQGNGELVPHAPAHLFDDLDDEPRPVLHGRPVFVRASVGNG